MQEEVENRTLTLIVSGTKFSGRTLGAAISRYLAHRSASKCRTSAAAPRKPNAAVTHRGKQTVKQLVGQGQGVNTVELEGSSVRDFDRVARKYGVDYAIKRDRSADPPKYLIFFKARDDAALTAALQEYAQVKIKKASRPSVRQKLEHFRSMIKKPVKDTEKNREPIL